MLWFSVAHVFLAFVFDDALWHSQSDFPVEAATFVSSSLAIFMKRVNFVSQEVCYLCSRVCDERFGFGHFQLELLLQECANLLLNILGFCFWSDKSEQKVVCIPYIFQSSKVWIVGVHRWQQHRLLLYCVCLFSVPFASEVSSPCYQVVVLLVSPSLFSACPLWDELCNHVFIQCVEVDVRQDGADHSTLRGATQCRVKLPVFHIP